MDSHVFNNVCDVLNILSKSKDNILKTIYKQEKEKNKDLTFEFLDDFMEYLRIQDESLKLRRKWKYGKTIYRARIN